MRKLCKNQGCNAPITFCKESGTPEFQECSYWQDIESKDSIPHQSVEKDRIVIPWSGIPFTPQSLSIIKHRGTPQIIGLIGPAKAGKTSYLGMIYTLLFNGKQFEKWKFGGSQTLVGWETQARTLKIGDDGTADFPEPTPSASDFYSFYHLMMKSESNIEDIIFADSSGEVFTKWANNVNDSSSENARWIYKNADAIMLFVDCESIINKKAVAKFEIAQLAGQISKNLNGRPLTIVWSKSDRKSEISETIRNAIELDLKREFPEALSVEISNFSATDPDELCHINNLKATESILNLLNKVEVNIQTATYPEDTDDFFYLYRGRYGTK